MTTLVDADVLLDAFRADPQWQDWSRDHLRAALNDGKAIINPLIYAEVSLAFAHEHELDRELNALGLARHDLYPMRRRFREDARTFGIAGMAVSVVPPFRTSTSAPTRWSRVCGSSSAMRNVIEATSRSFRSTRRPPDRTGPSGGESTGRPPT